MKKEKWYRVTLSNEYTVKGDCKSQAIERAMHASLNRHSNKTAVYGGMMIDVQENVERPEDIDFDPCVVNNEAYEEQVGQEQEGGWYDAAEEARRDEGCRKGYKKQEYMYFDRADDI